MALDCTVQAAVDIAKATESARQAAERMHQRSVGALVVVDNRNTPVGIVTDRDLVIRLLAAGSDPDTTTVREVMTPSPRTIPKSASTKDALAMMRAGNFRRLPVVNELGHLNGIVALDDILMSLAEQMLDVGALLTQETPRAAAESFSAVR
jgi:CBS domain-containing protein